MPSFTPRSVLADVEMDEDFVEAVEKFKDTELTPEQMALKIQADRVIYTLNRCLAKLNTVAHFPFLLQNDAELLRKYLSPNEAFFVLEALSEWRLDFDVSDIQPTEFISEYLKIGNINRSPTKKQQPTAVLPEDFPNAQVYQIVDIIFYNKCLQSIIRSTEKPKIDWHVMSLIKLLQDLKNIAKTKLYTTGDEQNAMEKELRRAYKSNVLLTAAIEDLKQQLEKQRKELGDQLNEKLKVFEMYNEKMETVKENFEIEMRKTQRDTEKTMMQKTMESEEAQAFLADEAERVVKRYQDLLQTNLQAEGSSRAKRSKIETQLQNWINTFDQDIGEKQAQFDQLQEEYDQKKAEIDEAQKVIDEQEEEYNRLMAEKAEEEERLYNEMAYQFFLDRSARKIQRYWRAYVEKKATKKKKGKKKK
ncbi:dynein regulatory complex protein 10 [Diabrotica virgifera virgifera]|uniref:Dynein regulatory complex protein 10 n=1 Tax=Diabrotica virgifera virgifera TaxID=50390 RepID=A0A6P7G140_DIAVI|nr:dynein regulatory complex protein 10 [Diabrotica virgifera virgifera]